MNVKSLVVSAAVAIAANLAAAGPIAQYCDIEQDPPVSEAMCDEHVLANPMPAWSFASAPVVKYCDIEQDPPVSETTCEDRSVVTTGDWVKLSPRSRSVGLFSTGALNVDLGLWLGEQSNTVALSRIYPAFATIDSKKRVQAIANESRWIELVWSRDRAEGVSALRLVDVGYEDGVLASKVLATHLTASRSDLSFNLSYVQASGGTKLVVRDADKTVLLIKIAGFSSLLPQVKVRAGIGLSDNQISAASFRVNTFTAQ